jgi:hypothetical protein
MVIWLAACILLGCGDVLGDGTTFVIAVLMSNILIERLLISCLDWKFSSGSLNSCLEVGL